MIEISIPIRSMQGTVHNAIFKVPDNAGAWKMFVEMKSENKNDIRVKNIPDKRTIFIEA
jgi:hypothetical protein